jgi:surfeit locus 1 family protein
VTPLKRAGGAALALIFFCGFVALGTWQLQRRAWKLDLIARVDARAHAAPVAAPDPREWPEVTAKTHEYLHVRATGTLLNDAATAVRALTELGSGYWVLTPLRTSDGSIILINRGFVAVADARHIAKRHAADGPITTITGLLRMPEPGGAFLRRNDAAANRWYSRDVRAIAIARGIAPVAPYFIDADRSASPDEGADSPIGGLTVIAFPNNHLLYSITWYTLALMIPVSLALALRDAR